jgi:hypothetical protein
MGLKYYHPELRGFLELVHRRKIHVLTQSGGHDKVILIYRYECQLCGFTDTAAGLEKIRKLADRHYGITHGGWGNVVTRAEPNTSEDPDF